MPLDSNLDKTTRTQAPLTKTKLEVLSTIWPTLSAPRKQELWRDTWHSGLHADSIGSSFMHNCINDWEPSSVQETMLKISTLVGTMESLGRMVKPRSEDVPLTEHTVHYASLLSKELHAMKGRWSLDGDSLAVWTSLERFPQFHAQVGTPHPWMLSLCAAWQQDTQMVPLRPASYHAIETPRPGVTLLMDIEEPTITNPLNPIDHLLARALKTMRTSNPVVAPEVQGLFGILDGTDNLLGAVLSLPHPGDVHEDINSILFEDQP